MRAVPQTSVRPYSDLVLLELAPVYNPGDDVPHVVLARRRVREDAVDFAAVECGRRGWLPIEHPTGTIAYRAGQRADAMQARRVVRLAKVDRAADGGVHPCAAKLLRGDFLADRRLDECRPGEIEAAALGHQQRVAHDRQIRPAGDAVAHDRGNLRNAARTHHRVVVEDPAEIVLVREHLLLQRKEDPRRIDEIDRGDPILEGDDLRAQDLLAGHREKGAGFHRGVVGDHHELPAAHGADPRDHPARRRAAPLFVHPEGGKHRELEKRCARIDQRSNALACRETSLGVLTLDPGGSTAEADRLFVLAKFSDERGHRRRVPSKLGARHIDPRNQSVRR